MPKLSDKQFLKMYDSHDCTKSAEDGCKACAEFTDRFNVPENDFSTDEFMDQNLQEHRDQYTGLRI